MCRVWLEDVLGFHLRGTHLFIRPSLPEDWKSCEITYRFRSSTYRISMERVSHGNMCSIDCDGSPVEQDFANLHDDGNEHQIHVRIGGAESRSGTRGVPDPEVRSLS